MSSTGETPEVSHRDTHINPLQVSLAIKLPPATVAVLLLGPLGLLGLDRARRREVAIVAAVPAIVLFAFDVSLGGDIGVRYLLPVLALWLVVAGAAWSGSRNRTVRVGLAAAVGLGVWAMVASFPHSLSWTDPVFGAPYQAATNSSIDWVGSGPLRTPALGSQTRHSRGVLRAAWDHTGRHRAGVAADRRLARADHRLGCPIGNGSDDRRQPGLAARVLPRRQHRRHDPDRSLPPSRVGRGGAR